MKLHLSILVKIPLLNLNLTDQILSIYESFKQINKNKNGTCYIVSENSNFSYILMYII